MARTRRARAAKPRPAKRRPATKRRRALAESVKQPEIIAVTVPASPTSDTGPARKLLDAIGQRSMKTKQRKRATKRR